MTNNKKKYIKEKTSDKREKKRPRHIPIASIWSFRRVRKNSNKLSKPTKVNETKVTHMDETKALSVKIFILKIKKTPNEDFRIATSEYMDFNFIGSWIWRFRASFCGFFSLSHSPHQSRMASFVGRTSVCRCPFARGLILLLLFWNDVMRGIPYGRSNCFARSSCQPITL